MKEMMKKSRKLPYVLSLFVLVAIIFAGTYFYYRNEYQALTFNYPNGGSVTISRHNFNKMTAAQKQALQNPVDENSLHDCKGNASDKCIATPSIDFWPGGSESASNPDLKLSDSEPNEIMGRIIDSSTNVLKLKTSSGSVISVTYPVNPVNVFNSERSSNYGFKINDGDEIYVSYSGLMENNNIKTN